MQRINALWNRGLVGKAVIVLGVVVIVCCVIGVLVPRRPAQQGAAPTALATRENAAEGPPATAAPAPTEAPAATAGPTDTPAPTNTPVPTATPAPTDTPEPTATPVPPVELSGRGQQVTDKFTLPAPVTRVVATHQGRRNFIIYAYNAAGDKTLVANAIGNYEGSRLLTGEGEFFLEVDADGPWSITVEPVPIDEAAAQGVTGHGDFVSGLFMPGDTGPVPYAFSHVGKRNFIVQLHCAGGSDLAVNEIGSAEGSVIANFKKGPCLWEVEADGDWSLKPK